MRGDETQAPDRRPVRHRTGGGRARRPLEPARPARRRRWPYALRPARRRDGDLPQGAGPAARVARRRRGARAPGLLRPAASPRVRPRGPRTGRAAGPDGATSFESGAAPASSRPSPSSHESPNSCGGIGCTVESCTYRDRLGEFAALGAAVVGVSTQRPSEQADFAAANGIRFPLLSDADLELTTALHLPTFRAGGRTRLRRLTLVVDHHRVVRATSFPIPDVTGSVEEALRLVRGLAARRRSPRGRRRRLSR